MTIEQQAVDPQWDKTTRVSDWRNYVGERTRALWSTLTGEQKIAIAKDAYDLAGMEGWD